MRLLHCVYGECVALHGCKHVCVCVCLYGDCVAFVCASGHVWMVIVGVCLGVCVFVGVCVLVWWLCCVCMSFWPCLHGDCGCLRGCIMCDFVCACIVVVLCLYMSPAMFAW